MGVDALLLDLGSNTEHVLLAREVGVVRWEGIGLGRLSEQGLPERGLCHGRQAHSEGGLELEMWQ